MGELLIDHSPADSVILGQAPPKTSYNLKIPDNCTTKQLGIFLSGFLTSMGVAFEFSHQDFEKIHPEIRGWFVSNG
tara:strand:+ start:1366 stop:1593 length:228 start_codon:yes stop_codon:yes gene_type:complete